MRNPFLSLFLLLCPLLLCAQQDSVRINQPLRFSIRQLQLPAGLVAAGLLSNGRSEESVKYEMAESRNRNMSGFHTTADNYLQYAPIAIAYGLDAAGVKSRTDLVNRSAILLKGELMMLGTVNFLKKTTHTLRPDGTTYNSFPSGHTAQAFAAATFLSEEYKKQLPWMPYAAYGMASSVGLLRMANNRHYVSDVLVGAGIGILSMKLAYWTHQYKWTRSKRRELPVF